MLCYDMLCCAVLRCHLCCAALGVAATLLPRCERHFKFYCSGVSDDSACLPVAEMEAGTDDLEGSTMDRELRLCLSETSGRCQLQVILFPWSGVPESLKVVARLILLSNIPGNGHAGRRVRPSVLRIK